MKDDMLKNIDRAILSTTSEDGSSFLDTFLNEEGYNLDEIKKVSSKAYKQQAFLVKGKLNYQNDQRLLEKVSNKLASAINEKLDKPIAYLKSLIRENRLGVQYRNLDKLGVDDIKDMIRDQNLLELLEMFDEEDKS